MNMQVGPNRLKFQFPTNTGATQVGHIYVQVANTNPLELTVTQAGAGFTPAGVVPIIKSIQAPKGIDVD